MKMFKDLLRYLSALEIKLIILMWNLQHRLKYFNYTKHIL
jgi:hypothetical protein